MEREGLNLEYKKCSMISTDLRCKNLSKADLTNSSFYSCDLREADFTNSILTNTTLMNCNLLRINSGVPYILSSKGTSISIISSSKYIVMLKSSREVQVYEDDKLYTRIDTSNSANCIAFIQENLLTGNLNGSISLWNLEERKEILNWKVHEGKILCVDVLYPNIVSSGIDKLVKVSREGQVILVFEGHQFEVNCVNFSSSGRYIVSGSSDRKVKIWDCDTQTQVHEFSENSFFISCAKFSPDESLIACGSYDKTLTVWRAENKQVVFKITAHSHRVYTLDFSRSGNYIVTGGADRNTRVWNSLTGQIIASFIKYTWPVISVSVSADDRHITVGYLNSLCIVNRLNVSCSYVEPQHQICAIDTFDFNFALAYSNHRIHVGNLKTGLIEQSWLAHNQNINAVVFIDTSRLASASDDTTIKIWYFETGDLLHSLDKHLMAVKHLKVDPNRQVMASGGPDGLLYLWDLDSFTNQEFRFSGNIQDIALSPTAGQVAVINSDYIRLFDTKNFYKGSNIRRKGCNKLFFSMDGMNLFTIFEKTLWSNINKGRMESVRDFSRYLMKECKGKYIGLVNRYGYICVREYGSNEILCVFTDHTNETTHVSITEKGFLTIGDNSSIKYWKFKGKIDFINHKYQIK